MKTEHLAIGAGAVFLAGLVMMAVIPEELWEGEIVSQAAGVSMAGAPGTMMNANCPGRGLGGPCPRGSSARPSSSIPRAQPVAMAGMTPFEVAPLKPFRGDVQQMIQRGDPAQWGQVHVLLSDVSGDQVEISLAPRWYLQYLGCALSSGVRVRGMAFDFDGRTPSPVLYAKDLTVQGTKCRLRNDEGFALWSNQLRGNLR